LIFDFFDTEPKQDHFDIGFGSTSSTIFGDRYDMKMKWSQSSRTFE